MLYTQIVIILQDSQQKIKNPDPKRDILDINTSSPLKQGIQSRNHQWKGIHTLNI